MAPGIPDWICYTLATLLTFLFVHGLYKAFFGIQVKGPIFCPKCSYIMEGLKSRRCPECGVVAKSDRAMRRIRRPWLRGSLGLLCGLLAIVAFRYPLAKQNGWWSLAPNTLMVLAYPTIETGLWSSNDWRRPAMINFLKRLGPTKSSSLGRDSLWDWQWRLLIRHWLAFESDEDSNGWASRNRPIGDLRLQLLEVAIHDGLIQKLGYEDVLRSKAPMEIKPIVYPEKVIAGVSVPVNLHDFGRLSSVMNYKVSVERVDVDGRIVFRRGECLFFNSGSGYIDNLGGYIDAIPIAGNATITLRVEGYIPSRNPPSGEKGVQTEVEMGIVEVVKQIEVIEPTSIAPRPIEDEVFDRLVQESFSCSMKIDPERPSRMIVDVGNDAFWRRNTGMGGVLFVDLRSGGSTIARSYTKDIRKYMQLSVPIGDMDSAVELGERTSDWSLRFYVEPSFIARSNRHSTYWPGEIIVPIDWKDVLDQE